MIRATYSTQKLKLEKEIKKLEKQMENLQKKQRGPAITSIVRSMREYDISIEEITAALARSGRGTAGRKAAPAKTAKRVIPPKYRHPETQATWTGRGKAPRWITEAEAEGTSRDTFLIA